MQQLLGRQRLPVDHSDPHPSVLLRLRRHVSQQQWLRLWKRLWLQRRLRLLMPDPIKALAKMVCQAALLNAQQ